MHFVILPAKLPVISCQQKQRDGCTFEGTYSLTTPIILLQDYCLV